MFKVWTLVSFLLVLGLSGTSYFSQVERSPSQFFHWQGDYISYNKNWGTEEDWTSSYNQVEQEFKSHSTGALILEKNLIKNLRKYKFIFVPGVELGTSLSPLPRQRVRFAKYFKVQRDWLTQNQMDSTILDINTETSSRQNARALIKEIKSSSQKIVLVGHSKGGMDIYLALLKFADKSIRSRIKLWINYQTPFFGSDFNKLQLSGLKKEMEFLELHAQGTLSLSPPAKAKLFNLTTVRKINNTITSEIPMLNYYSEMSPKSNSPFYQLSKKLSQQGANDGVIVPKNANFPGSKKIIVKGVDHFSTVMEVTSITHIPFTSWTWEKKFPSDQKSTFLSLLSLGLLEF
jgi:hypothetical protein